LGTVSIEVIKVLSQSGLIVGEALSQEKKKKKKTLSEK
jgi:hypothetical protein